MSDPQLPYSIDDERAVLGAVLLNRDAIIPIAAWLKPAHFYLEKHAWIYQAMLSCYDAQTPPDIRLVASALRDAGRLDAIGGIVQLSDLIDAVPVAYHVEHYARVVERMAVQRAIIVAGGQIAAMGYRTTDADKLIAACYSTLDSAADRPALDTALVPLAEIVDQRYQDFAAAQQQDTPLFGIPTGFRDLDEMTGGLQRSDLLLLAARPSVGKSSLALCFAYAIAGAGHRIDLFSLEMSREQVLDRLIAIHTGINVMYLRQLRMRDNQLGTYMDALAYAHTLPIAIDDQAGLTVPDIRARILRRAARVGAPDVVMIDYLQLMYGAKRTENRVQEVSEISRSLKGLAKELHVPVIALSQLSRAVEGRTSHVPMLSDLRESGSLEQDADIVMFIYREELYDRETDKKGVAELHIAKHRNGATGVIPLRFDAITTRFSDLTYRTPAGY